MTKKEDRDNYERLRQAYDEGRKLTQSQVDELLRLQKVYGWYA